MTAIRGWKVTLIRQAWPGSSSPEVGSIWNGLGDSQVKKVDRSLGVGPGGGDADQSHFAPSDHCPCFRKVEMPPLLPHPIPHPTHRSLLLPGILLPVVALPTSKPQPLPSPRIFQAEPGLGHVPHGAHGQLQGRWADQIVAGQGGSQVHTEHPLRFLKPQLVHVLLLRCVGAGGRGRGSD